jgi:hypothetical protein
MNVDNAEQRLQQQLSSDQRLSVALKVRLCRLVGVVVVLSLTYIVVLPPTRSEGVQQAAREPISAHWDALSSRSCNGGTGQGPVDARTEASVGNTPVGQCMVSLALVAVEHVHPSLKRRLLRAVARRHRVSHAAFLRACRQPAVTLPEDDNTQPEWG